MGNTRRAKNRRDAVTTEISLRPEVDGDLDFLRALYASTRADELELLAWSDDQREQFLAMQFDMRQAHYRGAYDEVGSQIVLLEGRPIGRLYVHRSDSEIYLVDIALLAQHRGAGIGAKLIRELLAEATASGKPVRLTAEQGSAAVRLYEGLGFRRTGETEIHISMQWDAPAAGR
jgi:ribosomal protein S18 acetylase RimI-like enzyme